MRKRWLALGIAPLLLVPAAPAAMYWSVSHPSSDPLPVPARLVALPTPEGQALLATATGKADVETLERAFQTQEKGTWCGVASSAAVLSAMRGSPIRQDDFFTDEAEEVRSFWRVTFSGMPLGDLGALLRSHGVAAEVHHAGDGVEVFRKAVERNLSTPGDYLIVNYRRGDIDQEGAGHISPVSAYDAASDRVLVLDTASYKYAPFWVATADLYAAMNTVDSEVDATRGWVEVRAN